MPRNGKARVLTDVQKDHLFDVIQTHRHAEKNTAIMQISFKLGLRAQEIALLQIKEVARLNRYRKTEARQFTLHEIMSLPAAYTKGADALGRSKSSYVRQTISMKVDEFNRMVRQVEALAKSGAVIEPADFYPPPKKHKGKSRDLPLVDKALRQALNDYLCIRLEKDPGVKATDPLFLTQKGGPYSPNTLQEHMAMMLRDWAGVEKASSHSGRRSLLTHIIHEQGKPLSVAQKVAGHVNPSTTIGYAEPTEEDISDALKDC